jgi:beta-lactam-binding protein with PASTA domain
MTEEVKGKRLWKRIIVALVIWFIVLPLIAMGAFAIVHYRHERARPAQKTVPNLKGLDLKSAEATARDAGFVVQVVSTRWDLPGAPGTIVEQVPLGGESVPFNTIAVTLSIEDPNKHFGKKKENESNTP